MAKSTRPPAGGKTRKASGHSKKAAVDKSAVTLNYAARFPHREGRAVLLLASNVRRLRKERGLTQVQLAAALDVDQNIVSLIENSRANPALLLVEQIAMALSCQMGDLFEDDTDGTRRGADGDGR